MQPEMWKWGQVRPGDKVKFCLTTVDFAMAKRRLLRDRIAAVHKAATTGQALLADSHPVRPHWLRAHASEEPLVCLSPCARDREWAWGRFMHV